MRNSQRNEHADHNLVLRRYGVVIETPFEPTDSTGSRDIDWNKSRRNLEIMTPQRVWCEDCQTVVPDLDENDGQLYEMRDCEWEVVTYRR